MKPSTLPGLLLLRRAAILDAFHSRWALPVGALLVLSAGLARNYDGEDLLAEPWWLAGPFVASLITSLVLWTIFISWARMPIKATWRLYPRFLAVYWLTAPLAWLYGIPYEQFLTPADAVRVNALTLAVVSLWRVLIISRVFSTLFVLHFKSALCFTLLFGALVLFVATLIGPRPVLDVMGGLRLSDEEQARSNIVINTACLSIVAIPVLAILTAITRSKDMRGTTPPPSATPPASPRPAFIIATLCVLAWLPALIVKQPQQRNRTVAERAYEQSEIDAMYSRMAQNSPADYPANWQPPASVWRSHRSHALLAKIVANIDADSPDWLRRAYLPGARESIIRGSHTHSLSDWYDNLTRGEWGWREFLEAKDKPGYSEVVHWLVQHDPDLPPDYKELILNLFKPAAAPPSKDP